MSELKAYCPYANRDGFYHKSEVDKVLAEKDKEIRRLNRALYKACANWALSTLAWLDCIDQGEPRKWSEMIQKCRAKADEYT